MLLCFLSILIFLHHRSFIFFSNRLPKLCQLTAIFSISSLQFINRVFLGLLWFLLHDPYRKFMQQERALHSKRVAHSKGQREGLGWSVTSFAQKPKRDSKQRKEQQRQLPATTVAGLTTEWGLWLWPSIRQAESISL